MLDTSRTVAEKDVWLSKHQFLQFSPNAEGVSYGLFLRIGEGSCKACL
jgi:hypothetical protein